MKKLKEKAIHILLISLFSTSICIAQNVDDSHILSLSCKNADVIDILRAIAIQNGVNIVPDSTVSGTVTIHLANAPFETGLQTLLETNGFTLEKKDDIYLVHKKVVTKENVKITASDGFLTIDATGADALEVINQLSTKASINIVAESKLTGTITAHLSSVPIEDALNALFSAHNFTLYQNADIYYVGSRTSRQDSSFVIFFSKGAPGFPRNEGLLTIDVKDAPLADVLEEVATQTKINYVSIGDIKGSVTMRLKDVTLEQALNMLTAASGAAYKIVDGIYIVGNATARPGEDNPLLERKIIWLKHLEVAEVISLLPSNIPKTSVTPVFDHNAIIVLGTQQTIEAMEQLIEELDVENADIRSRKPSAIWVDVSEDGLLTVDAKDASMNLVIRELSIKAGIDIVFIESSGGNAVARSESTVARRVVQRSTESERQQAARQTTQQRPVRRSRYRSSRGDAVGNINIRLEKATLEKVFDALFSGTPYTYAKKQNGKRTLYLIGTGDLAIGIDNPLITSKKIPLEYLDVIRITEVLPPTISSTNITVIVDENAIVVTGTPQMITSLEEYLSQIDTPTPQVMIDVILLELTEGNTKDLGIEWSAQHNSSILELDNGAGFMFNSLEKVPDAFKVSLQALLTENKARILANPRVAVLSGATASINVGIQYLFQTTTEIYRDAYGTSTGVITTESGTQARRQPSRGQGTTTPYTSGGFTRRAFDTIDTGISLDITPWVGNAGEITMTIKPEIRDADRITAEESRIANRSIDTVIRVKDGGMIVIGGLLQEKTLSTNKKIPIIGRIPLLGNLFSSSNQTSSQSELVIIITPKLIP